jgi:3-methylfumaryl-CoA hydratase
LDIERLQDWVGRGEVRQDQIAVAPALAMAATLDIDWHPKPGDALPPLWHWLYFLDFAPQSELGPDGHAKRGGFLPPVELPRRMWAGGRLEFHHPLHVGESIARASRIASVQFKQGRTGPLVFVVVHHEISNGSGLAVTEEHDIVYRGHSSNVSHALQTSPAEVTWQRVITPDDVLLFRYSALTFNGHRIHYDRRYATETEGYPGLVVHGPLIATLLVELIRLKIPAATVSRFEFKAVSPLFDTAPFSISGNYAEEGKVVRLWATGPTGALAMTATARL